MTTLIGILTGIVLSACNIEISSWEFWVIALLAITLYALGYMKGKGSND